MESITFGEKICIEPTLHLKPSSDNEHAVYVRLRVHQKGFFMDETLISTGVKCKKNQWNGMGIDAKKTDKEARRRNTRLSAVGTAVDDWLRETRKKKAAAKNWREIFQYIKSDLKPLINPEGKKATKEQKAAGTIPHLIEMYLAGKDISDGYRKKFGELNAYMKQYAEKEMTVGMTQYANREVTVDMLTKQFTTNFVAWMHKRMKHNAAATYTGKLQSLIKLAIHKEYISVNEKADKGTFKKFRKGDGVNLTEKELLQISSLTGLRPGMERMKNLFLFMCSTSLGLGELRAVRKCHFRDIDGATFLMKAREKSDEPFKIPLSPFAAKIYNGYFNWMDYETGNVTDFEPFEKVPSDSYCLKNFKELVGLAGINKLVGTYTPRRTYATNYIRNGGSIYKLKDIMGHADIKTTWHYVNLATDDLSEDANKVYSITGKNCRLYRWWINGRLSALRNRCRCWKRQRAAD